MKKEKDKSKNYGKNRDKNIPEESKNYENVCKSYEDKKKPLSIIYFWLLLVEKSNKEVPVFGNAEIQKT